VEDINTQVNKTNNEPMSVGQWVATILLLAIPLVNIVLLFVWAFGGNVNTNKKNYCRAALIIAAVVLVLYIIFFIAFGAAIFNGLSNMGGY
jgi:hypothetical protein